MVRIAPWKPAPKPELMSACEEEAGGRCRDKRAHGCGRASDEGEGAVGHHRARGPRAEREHAGGGATGEDKRSDAARDRGIEAEHRACERRNERAVEASERPGG